MADEKLNILTLALAKKYTDNSLAGAGAVSGVPCQIQSITSITGGNRITFLWEDNNGVSHTSTMDVMNGDKGDTGDTGKGIKSVAVNSSNHLIVTYTDDTTTDAGEIDVSSKANKVSGATEGNFASLTSSGDMADSGKSASDFADSWLKGKIISFVGDSITRGGITGGHLEHPFPELIGNILHCTSHNYGVDGSTLANNSNAHSPIVDRVSKTDIDEDSDVIMLMGGVNDLNYTDSLGTYDSTDTKTIYGALNSIGNTLMNDFPSATVIFCSNLRKANMVKNDNYSLKQVNQAIKDVARKFGFVFFDLYNQAPMYDPAISTLQSRWNTDSTHPNQDYISDIFSRYLAQRFLTMTSDIESDTGEDVVIYVDQTDGKDYYGGKTVDRPIQHLDAVTLAMCGIGKAKTLTINFVTDYSLASYTLVEIKGVPVVTITSADSNKKTLKNLAFNTNGCTKVILNKIIWDFTEFTTRYTGLVRANECGHVFVNGCEIYGHGASTLDIYAFSFNRCNAEFSNVVFQDLAYLGYFVHCFVNLRANCTITDCNRSVYATMGSVVTLNKSGLNYVLETQAVVAEENDRLATLKDVKDADTQYTPNHVIQKCMNFYQKTGLFFGDSIAAGGKAQVGKDLVSYTKTLLMMTSITNEAVGSTRFTHGDVNPTIIDKIKSTTLNTDYIFIAGGINDWQSQANLTDYKTDLEGLMQYLKANYTGNVIFISPINYVLDKIAWDNGYKQATNKIEIIEYRRILEELVIKYNYNLVCGELFPFPTNLGERANVLMSDGLHPTTYGHQMYAFCLTNALGCNVAFENSITQSSNYRFSGRVNSDGRCIFLKYKNGQMTTATESFAVDLASRIVNIVGTKAYISDGDNMIALSQESVVYNKTSDEITVTVPSAYVSKYVYIEIEFTFDASKIVDDSY